MFSDMFVVCMYKKEDMSICMTYPLFKEYTSLFLRCFHEISDE